MNVLPQDLGEKRCEGVVLQRAGFVPVTRGEANEPLGFWGRVWLGKLKKQITPKEAQPILQAVRSRARWSAGFGIAAVPLAVGSGIDVAGNADNPLPGLFCFGIVSAGAWFLSYANPQHIVARKYQRLYTQPLTAGEIAALLPQTHDELERSYLTLVMDVSRQEVQPAAGANLRAALRSLGEAIDKLPATRVMVSDDHDIITEVLQRTAAETLKKAQEEPDRIAAASLMRRVEALHRRADATKRANTLTRRFSVLRQEMAAETEALRAGLTAYYSGAHDIADLTQLAEDMQQLATEASSLTEAVEEVDTFSAGRISAAPATPVVNRVRLG